jgi:hypothetical protein
MAYIGNQPTTVAFLTDQFSGTGSQTAFTLSAAPANTASILVAVSGVLQDPSTYSVSGTTLTFSAAPPSGTGNISVRFLGIPASGVVTTAYRTQTEFTATSGQTTFTPPSYTPGFIDVYRNGVLLGSADFTATNGTTVVLAIGATAGDLIETVSFYVSSVLNAIPATAGAVNSTYLLDGSVTRAKMGYAGAVLQVVSTTKTDTFTTTSTSYTDITGLSVSITPTSASNKILVIYSVMAGANATAGSNMRLVRNSTAIAIGDAAGSRTLVTTSLFATNSNNFAGVHNMNFLDSPATTSSTTYKLQILSDNASTIAINRNVRDDNAAYDPRGVSTITVMEIAG